MPVSRDQTAQVSIHTHCNHVHHLQPRLSLCLKNFFPEFVMTIPDMKVLHKIPYTFPKTSMHCLPFCDGQTVSEHGGSGAGVAKAGACQRVVGVVTV